MNRSGQSKLLAKAIQQIEEQERKLKLLQLKRRSLRKELLEGARASLNATVGCDLDQNSLLYYQKLAFSDTPLDRKQKGNLLSRSATPSLGRQNRMSWSHPDRSEIEHLTQSLNHIHLNDRRESINEENEKSPDKIQNSNGILSFLTSSTSKSNLTGPIENDEWLAFLQSTMEEIMEGSATEMQQHNFVAIVISPLHNPSTGCKVIEYVACLLSLPFVVEEISEEQHEQIYQVRRNIKF